MHSNIAIITFTSVTTQVQHNIYVIYIVEHLTAVDSKYIFLGLMISIKPQF